MDTTALEPLIAAALADAARRGLTLAVAESVTGGGFCQLCTAIPGASQVLLGGAVVYTPTAKIELTGIDAEVLALEGTVSVATSTALAGGIRERLGASLGMAVTGNAGPTTEGNAPVGTIWWSVVGPVGTMIDHRELAGDRAAVRWGALLAGCELLQDYLNFMAERDSH